MKAILKCFVGSDTQMLVKPGTTCIAVMTRRVKGC